jgi:hypothetical protein
VMPESQNARQWLCKHIPAAANTHAIIEELLDAVSMLSLCNK